MNTNFKRPLPWENAKTDWQEEIANAEKAEELTTFSVRFWLKIKEFAERRWLKAHGWIEVRDDGWLMPHWHPTLKRYNATYGGTKGRAKVLAFAVGKNTKTFKNRVDTAIKELREPFDLNHAANSQRAHTKLKTPNMLPDSSIKVTEFPAYVRWKPLQLAVFALANVLGVASLYFVNTWLGLALWFVAVSLVIVSFCIGWKARKDWELDWAETQLSRGTHRDIHRSN